MSDIQSRLEELASEGFHLVVSEAEKFIIEKTHLDGTRAFSSETLEGVVAAVEGFLAKHPGAFGHTVSRSDGLHEGVDLLTAQAGAAANTQAAADVAAPEPAAENNGSVVAEQPGEVATGRIGEPEPEPSQPSQPDIPEGAIQS